MRTRLEFFDATYFGAVLAGAEHWAKDRGVSNSHFADDAMFIVGMAPKIILDVGCGRGELMAHIAYLGAGNIKCVGVDPATISAAYRRCTFNEFQVEDLCVASDNDFAISDKPYGAAGYDLVIARNLFECLDPDAVPRAPNAEVKRITEKLRGWLRPGGRILFRTAWGAAPWSKPNYEKAYNTWLAMGHARHLVPWVNVDEEGRMDLGRVTQITRTSLYDRLTLANPWEGDALALATKYYPGMKSHYDADSDWLILQEP